MKYKELELHASNCQLAADELAIKMIKQNTISVVQSICDFNLTWAYQLSPEVSLHIESIEFLEKHLKRFTRKITIKEMFKFDSLIYWHNPETFEKFKTLI